MLRRLPPLFSPVHAFSPDARPLLPRFADTRARSYYFDIDAAIMPLFFFSPFSISCRAITPLPRLAHLRDYAARRADMRDTATREANGNAKRRRYALCRGAAPRTPFIAPAFACCCALRQFADARFRYAIDYFH